MAHLQVVTRAQLLAAGIGRGAIDHALAAGRTHLLHPGVYGLAPALELPPLARDYAAVAACGEAALLDGPSAVGVWGFAPPWTGDVHVVIPGGSARRAPGIIIHRSSTLTAFDRREFRGIPITSPARALLDAAEWLTARELERAFDEALVKRLVARSSVLDQVQRNSNRPGAALLRELADPARHTTLTESEKEEAMLSLLRRGHVAAPETAQRVGRYRADFLWRRHRVIVEVDGYAFHSTRSAFERDRRRDAEHQAMGYIVLRFSARQLVEEPELVLAQIAAVLARREPRLVA